MAENTVPTVDVDTRIAMGIYLIGIAAVVTAVYHTGTTGNWLPTALVSSGLALAVLFINE